MTTQPKILFVINPASGTTNAKPGAEKLKVFFQEHAHVEVAVTLKSGDATAYSTQAIAEGFETVVAVGGDGTVNEIASALNGTNIKMGILPFGSGNGLARHHHIPFNLQQALQIIRQGKYIMHDAVSINDKLSFNVSGIGFDAHVAHLFGKDGRRGFSGYVNLVMKEFNNYKESEIEISHEHGKSNHFMFLTALANASQFGNNAIIAPNALTHDGKVDLALVKKMNSLQLPLFFARAFFGKITGSSHYTAMQFNRFTIRSEKALPLHLDGEPAGYSDTFQVKVQQGSLKLLIP
ncbi:MAG: YegS/Rv2252/BmrU family lipid kinase [Bacteroidetes bacterium]|nr:YegS/Rv2252/BmrU family lipid kinase [Bacteroidota bacterium]MBK9049266.1 YegS/Rv2252/BmrU family lipid kinase [Bacteroidota bacterium]